MTVDPLWIGWPGKADSARPSWPEGIKSNVDWLDDGAGRALLDTLAGIDLRAWRMIYWWGGQVLGASLKSLLIEQH